MVNSRTVSSQASGAAIPRSGCASRGAVEGGELLADHDKVFAAVLQAAGNFVGEILLRQRRADRLQVAPVGGPGERGDLRAGIVDVVLLGDVVAGLDQQVGERVAHHGAAAMADMHRTGGIGGDVFDVDPRAGADAAVAIGLAAAQDVRQQRAEDGGIEPEVDEAGTGGGRLDDFQPPVQMLREGGGQLRRRLASGLGGDQRGVGRHVAVRRVARGGDLHPRGEIVRQAGHQCAQRVEHDVALDGVEVVAHVMPFSWPGRAWLSVHHCPRQDTRVKCWPRGRGRRSGRRS